ncbi:MAG: surface-adhesin E family protein [Thermodesulfobacteriota bacterium]
MKAFLFGLLITVTLVLSAASGARAVVWRPIGFGTMGDSRFRVFVDTESIESYGGKVRFWQGHVFYEEQPLPSGASFVRVSISRVVDCDQRSDSNLEAIFYGPSGDVVDKYGTQGAMQFNTVKPDTISEAVLNYVCDYVNKKG